MGAVAVWRVPTSRWFCVGGHVVEDAGGDLGVAAPTRAKKNFQSSPAARWLWWIVSSTVQASISSAR
jgi:hypothetical protein